MVNFGSALKGFSKSPVTVNLDLTNCPADMRGVIEGAIDKLNSIPTSGLKLKVGSDISTTSVAIKAFSFNDEIVVACDTDIVTNYSNTLSLQTTFGFSLQQDYGTLELQKSYVVINATPYTGIATYASFHNPAHSTNLRKAVLAHELGHALGLGHTEEESALMYFASGEVNSFNLHQDDIDGFTYLYSRDEFSDGALGCGQVKISGPTPPPTFLMMSLLLLVPFALNLNLRLKTTS